MGLFVDNFAGGDGANTGIELAIGRNVDIALNYDPDSRVYPKNKQVARCGNAVTPPVPAAMVRANLPGGMRKWCYGRCDRCVWKYNGGCSEWPLMWRCDNDKCSGMDCVSGMDRTGRLCDCEVSQTQQASE